MWRVLFSHHWVAEYCLEREFNVHGHWRCGPVILILLSVWYVIFAQMSDREKTVSQGALSKKREKDIH